MVPNDFINVVKFVNTARLKPHWIKEFTESLYV